MFPASLPALSLPAHAPTLARVLAGEEHIPLPTKRAKPLAAPLPPEALKPPARPPSNASSPSRPPSAIRRMYRVFATRSISHITEQVCADLGIDYEDDDPNPPGAPAKDPPDQNNP